MKSTAIIALSVLLLASASLQGPNWCGMKCKRCAYANLGLSTDAKSCDLCAFGIQTPVIDGTNAGFECKDSNVIPNCVNEYQNVGGTLACGACAEGFFVSGGNTCVAVTTKIDNCYRYASATLCGQCNKGYVDVLGASCLKMPAEVPNCEWHSSSDGCSGCAKGFYEVSGACVAEEKGCESPTQAVCRCRHRYYAVDHLGPAAGDKCEFSTRVLGFISVVAVAIFSVFAH